MTRKLGCFFNFSEGQKHLRKRLFNQDTMFYRDQQILDNLDVFPIIRLSLFILLLTICFFTIFARLIYLQIIKTAEYKKIAEGNRVFVRRIVAERGIITDRFGKELVINRPKYVIHENEKTREISDKLALQLEVKNLPEFKNVEILGKRKYLYPQEFSHVIGYLGEISQDELNDLKAKNYRQGDYVGRSGLEEQYENRLAGENGQEFYEINSGGEIVEKIGEKIGTPGENLKLSIDFDLQKVAISALKEVSNDPRYQGGNDVKGAVIVSRVLSGEILAMVSLPAFVPDEIAKYISDEKNFPLMNRAISATYPPGSTFKLVVSTAGLESDNITKNTLIEDTGVIKIGQWEFPTWSSVRDGMMDIVKGIKRSNDIFFYRAGEKIGLSTIVEYAKKFNLGQKLEIDLPAEAKGNLPSDAWKFENTGEHWYLGDTYHLAIGQGYILTTPLQVNAWTNIIASRGKLYRPHVVLNSKSQILSSKQILNSKSQNKNIRVNSSEIRVDPGELLQSSDYLIRDLHLKKETVDLIWKGMKEACQTGGTGWPLFDFKIPVACKTGTAEHLVGEATHAWFTAFAPADKPEIVVTVLIENGGQGSDVAAPVARKIFSKYFNVK
jgi:penicillin-binding protein 2